MTTAFEMSMSSRSDAEKDHFYPTPPLGTEALLSVEKFTTIWEPACGEGHMSTVLEDAGYDVVSTDLVDRGFGTPRIDFLMEYRLLAEDIVTNPPFKLAEEFVRKACDLGARKVAVLCRLTWLEGKERKKLFEQYPLARVWVFSSRLGMQKGKLATTGGMVPYAWYVFERGHSGPPTLGWV
jgi:hypothetical protein